MQSMSVSPSLSGLPVEILLDNLFPILPTVDLLRLTRTNKSFATLCTDETLWKRKLISDFNFSSERTARTSGWKFIYRGLSNPKVFVWGETANHRLGLSKLPRSNVYGVTYPAQLSIKRARIIDLVAGGMSFHALDTAGNIYVWGALDGSMSALKSDDFSQANQSASTPLMLLLPTRMRSISCGRLHSSSLDAEKKIWTFVNWGRPFYLSSPLFSAPGSLPLQVECGWAFSSVLTVSGDVFVWWPLSGRMFDRIQQEFEAMDRDGDKKAPLTPNGEISCVTWKLDMDPVRLPSIPTLPELSSTGNRSDKPYPQLVKIAALDGNIIGLTNQGHVLKFGGLDNEITASQGRWQYLPKFSDINEIRESLTSDSAPNAQDGGFPPAAMQITHISANFRHFTAYSTGSSSIVLVGDSDTTPESGPTIIPELQNKSVISVVIGDYHNGALTATGKLFTWGAFSNGALGLGDPTKLPVGSPGGFAREEQRIRALEHRVGGSRPPDVKTPTEVRFDHGKKEMKDRFCFSVTAAGWHTGALVIDLEPDEDEDSDSSSDHHEDTPENIQRVPDYRQWETPPIIPLPGIFRIGHAGRGLFPRGRGRGFGGGHMDGNHS